MPSFRAGRRAKPWKARRKIEGFDFLLGYFETRDEAYQAEQAFRREFPYKRDLEERLHWEWRTPHCPTCTCEQTVDSCAKLLTTDPSHAPSVEHVASP